MDGLLIAEQLRMLAGLLPAERRSWRFPDERTAVLPLASGSSLWLYSRPPEPRFEVREGAPPASAPQTPFQEQLAARAVGHLETAEQQALDRVLLLGFAPGTGFVPEPRTKLVAELTGRNANLVLLDEHDKILGVERVVLAERNRYRELRPGISYVPPPPYEKLDPLHAGDEVLREVLSGRKLREVPKLVDGVGPRLFAALLASVGSPAPGAALEGTLLAEVLVALQRIARRPSEALAQAADGADLKELREERLATEARSALRAELGHRRKLLGRRLTDAEQAISAASAAERLREEADLLLANAGDFAPQGGKAHLRDYDGGTRTLEVDQRLTAAANARARYDRARRRESRAERAAGQLPGLRQELAELDQAMGSLATAAGAALQRLSERWSNSDDDGKQRQRSGNRSGGRGGSTIGVRFVDPRGYEVFVGRSAKENDGITFKLARSRDLWLHVQGYRGAHVVVRNQGRELPFDTVLFAARLAAGFSQARGSDNVPVDYTERKNVWRPKGAPAGAVNFSHHKTVYVTPARDDAAAAGTRE